MDSQVTQTAQTLLDNMVAEYKALYSEYVSHLANVHNYHYDFLEKNYTLDTGRQVRVSLQKMMNYERRLIQLSLHIYRMNNQNLKEIRRANKKGFTKKVKAGPGRPKKIKTNNVDIPGSNSGGVT